MALKLPPLNALRLFEAAGRHRSFKLAAEELHLTPSAVSHGVQSLEDWLGAPLFSRSSRGLTLTVAGAAYLEFVSRALTTLADATEKVPGRRSRGTVRISVAPTFAKNWLLPRLPEFLDRHPALSIVLDTARRRVEFSLDEVDLVIRMSNCLRASESWTELFREELVPVCAPGAVGTFSLSALEALGESRLVHVTSVSEEWGAWFRALGYEPPSFERDIRVDTIQLALEAAMRGLGVALGRRPLIDELVATGRLSTLPLPAVRADTGYWLVGLEGAFERPEIKDFRAWIIRSAGIEPR